MTHIIDIVRHVSGNSTIGLDTETVVKLAGGQKNLQQGRVTKVTKGIRAQVFQNKNVNGYEAKVNRRLAAEGKPATFEVSARAWGQRLPNLPIVEHNGAHYLEVIGVTPGEVHYCLDGKPIDKKDIIGLPAPRTSTGQGGLDDVVIINTYKASSIRELRIDKKVYTDIEG